MTYEEESIKMFRGNRWQALDKQKVNLDFKMLQNWRFQFVNNTFVLGIYKFNVMRSALKRTINHILKCVKYILCPSSGLLKLSHRCRCFFLSHSLAHVQIWLWIVIKYQKCHWVCWICKRGSVKPLTTICAQKSLSDTLHLKKTYWNVIFQLNFIVSTFTQPYQCHTISTSVFIARVSYSIEHSKSSKFGNLYSGFVESTLKSDSIDIQTQTHVSSAPHQCDID